MFVDLWKDDSGALLSAELVLTGTVCVLGSVVGLSSMGGSVITELHDLGQAIGALNQSYQVGGTKSHDGHAFTGKSGLPSDAPDQCDVPLCEPCLEICVGDPGEAPHS